MVVGVLAWQLSLPGCSSLKEKRAVVRSLKDRLKHRYNVSVAETDHQDVLNRAEITIAVVATDGRFADTVLDKIDQFVASNAKAIVIGSRRELY